MYVSSRKITESRSFICFQPLTDDQLFWLLKANSSSLLCTGTQAANCSKRWHYCSEIPSVRVHFCGTSIQVLASKWNCKNVLLFLSLKIVGRCKQGNSSQFVSLSHRVKRMTWQSTWTSMTLNWTKLWDHSVHLECYQELLTKFPPSYTLQNKRDCGGVRPQSSLLGKINTNLILNIIANCTTACSRFTATSTRIWTIEQIFLRFIDLSTQKLVTKYLHPNDAKSNTPTSMSDH